MENLPILTGEKVVLRPITDADTDNIVRWRNTPSVRDNFIFRQTFTPEMHRNWLKTKVATGEVVQYIIVDKAADTAVGSVYYRDVDHTFNSAEYGIFIGEESARGLVWLPVLAVVLLPINAERSTLSTYFDEMGSQITAVETALQERMDARASADPWDNTLAYAYADDVFHGYLYAVPAGMGIEFDMNTYIADPEETIYSRYAMVNHGTDAEARLLADGWQPLISTEDLIVYERPDTQ